MFTQCGHNLHRGILIRVARPMPIGDEVLLERLVDFAEWITPRIYFPAFDFKRKTVLEYIYGKKTSMKNRIRDALTNPLGRLRKPPNSPFVKAELRAKKGWRPRVIQDVDPRWTAVFGPWCSSIASDLKRQDAFGYAFWFTPSQLEEWFQHNDDLEYVDFKGFDASLTEPIFRVERVLFALYGMPPHMLHAMYRANISWSSKTRFRNDIEFCFVVKGRCRQSGDPQTSIGNNYIAIMIHLFLIAYHHQLRHNLPYDWFKQSNFHHLSGIRMINNGDDNARSSTIYELPSHNLYPLLGVAVTREDSYCKLYPLYDGVRYRLAREPADFIVRFGFSRHYLECDAHRYSALHGNCIGYSYLVSGLPIYWALVKRCFYLTCSYKPDFQSFSSHTLVQLLENMTVSRLSFQKIEPPTQCMRESFATQFEFPVIDQLRLENKIFSLCGIDEMVVDEWLIYYLTDRL
jgi:hypothetical protein